MNTQERDRFYKCLPDNITDSGCFEWCGFVSDFGHGRFYFRGKRHYAHRIIKELQLGHRIQRGYLVLHKCDNPPCVNVEHLYIGTTQDNSNDMVNRGRHQDSRGENNGRSKFSSDEIQNIRNLYPALSAREISKQFSISITTAYRIVLRKSWRHI
jgi:hypothetical protein